jgi:hypothetical protein
MEITTAIVIDHDSMRGKPVRIPSLDRSHEGNVQVLREIDPQPIDLV